MSALLPIGGAALGTLARGAADAVRGGLTFAEELLSPPADAASGDAPATSAAPVPEELGEFEALLAERLAGLGIDASLPVRLTGDGFGNVRAGDHPQRAAIEALFEHDAELKRLYFEVRDATARLAFTPINSDAIQAGGPPADGLTLVLEAGRLHVEK